MCVILVLLILLLCIDPKMWLLSLLKALENENTQILRDGLSLIDSEHEIPCAHHPRKQGRLNTAVHRAAYRPCCKELQT